MALRVLLADESTTIKKVFQLSLQDYAVDVCAVTNGLDVASVAKQFKPDIVFCDILLQKRSGYEVCAEIKNDELLSVVPVVLMWSSFMELDEDRLQAAQADAHLEKPFEANDLRKLVNQLVPKTRTQRLSSFLAFPKMPEMVESPPAPQPAGGGLETHGSWSMESFDPIPDVHSAQDSEPGEDFQEVPLPPPPRASTGTPISPDSDEEDTQWSAKQLDRFKVDVPAEGEDEDLGVQLNEPPTPSGNTSASFAREIFIQNQNQNQNDEPDLDLAVDDETAPPPQTARPPAVAAVAGAGLSEAQLEKIIRAQSQAVIEAVVWKIVPDLAQQIIERELNRLLAEKS